MLILITVAVVAVADLDALPEFIQKKMKSSEGYQGRRLHFDAAMAAGGTEPLPPTGKPVKPRILGGPDTDTPNPEDIPF
jgi:hypothetical protein